MPIREPIVLGGTRGYSLRHIGPQAEIWPNPPVALQTVALLNQSSMISRPLPRSQVAASTDWQSGEWTGRLNDAGDGQVNFPNTVASDGVPWRDRFDSEGHNQFIEVYNDGELEQVFVVVQPNRSLPGITIAGSDGFWLTKKAYVRDWITTQAPRDVIDRGTRLNIPSVADNFPAGSINSVWNLSSSVSIADGPEPPTAAIQTGNPFGGINGDLNWTNVTNVEAADGVYATIIMRDLTYLGRSYPPSSKYIVATGYGFSIPPSSVILGIQVDVLKYYTTSSAGRVDDQGVSIVKGGVPQSVNKAAAGAWPTSAAYVSYGGPADTWGVTWLPSDINSSGFGVAICAIGELIPTGDSVEALVDFIRITVTYAPVEIQIGASGALVMTVPNQTSGDTAVVGIATNNLPCVGSGVWRAVCNIASAYLPGSATSATETDNASTTVASGSGVAWTGATTVGSPGGDATVTFNVMSGPFTSQYLECTGFGFSIPLGASVVGVTITISGNAGSPASVLLIKAGSMAGSDFISGDDIDTEGWGPTGYPSTIGSSTSLPGGITLAPSDVNASNFGVAIAVGTPTFHGRAPSTWTEDIAYPVTMTVTYTEGPALTFAVQESDGTNYSLTLSNIGFAQATATLNGSQQLAQFPVPAEPSYGLMLESDGDYIWGFVNGELVSGQLRNSALTTTLQTSVALGNDSTTLNSNAVINSVFTNVLQPFLIRGDDFGDWVLPGDGSTYPNGGLHARYFNEADLGNDPARLLKIQHPMRSQSYAGSVTAEYLDQQDAQIAGQQNPVPGAALSNWSVLWFGSIWLEIAEGNYEFEVVTPSGGDSAVRVWIGRTQLGQQLVDEWEWQNGGTFTFIVAANLLIGTLPNGGGLVYRSGWYPLKVMYAVDGTALTAPVLNLINSPAAYVDPGGSSIALGAQTTSVPQTSLSPLGCLDQRYQGIAHFDLVQQSLQSTGYQASFEPKRLESGLFPGVFAPRIREGQDVDIVLKPDVDLRAEAVTGISALEDASDFAASLQGNGAGFQSTPSSGGPTLSGNLQGLVFDPPTLLASLFDVQGWQDFSDAAFASLLQADLNSLLGLRLEPWISVTAVPIARERLAQAWSAGAIPLAGPAAKMRWRPGDGVRLRAWLINIWDTEPRQLLSVQRNFVPDGVAGTAVGWANRPRTPAHTLKQQQFTVSRLGRTYQKHFVELTGSQQTVTGLTSATSAPSVLNVFAGDQIIALGLRISVNSAAVGLNVVVNGVDETTQLNGPFGIVPLNLPLNPVALSSSNQITVALKNTTGTPTNVSFQILCDVLR